MCSVGLRRECDIEHFLEHWSRQEGLTVLTLSIDIALSPASDRLEDGLFSLLRQGWRAATVLGPPCCTWSRARHRLGGLLRSGAISSPLECQI